jgi:hypothetical protein
MMEESNEKEKDHHIDGYLFIVGMGMYASNK